MKTDERRLAAANALRQVSAAREIAFRPLCRDCRFGPVRSGDPNICEHFAHWDISPDRRLRIDVTTERARSVDGLCGPEAMLFQPYKGLRKVARIAQRFEPVQIVMVPLIVIGTILGAVFS